MMDSQLASLPSTRNNTSGNMFTQKNLIKRYNTEHCSRAIGKQIYFLNNIPSPKWIHSDYTPSHQGMRFPISPHSCQHLPLSNWQGNNYNRDVSFGFGFSNKQFLWVSWHMLVTEFLLLYIVCSYPFYIFQIAVTMAHSQLSFLLTEFQNIPWPLKYQKTKREVQWRGRVAKASGPL